MATRSHHPLAPYAFLLPATLVLGVFFVGSTAAVGWFSLTRYTAFEGPQFVGVHNYERVLTMERFWRCVLNSFAYLAVTPAIVVLSLLAAMTLEACVRARRWLSLLLFLPVVTPTIVGAFAWRLILSEESGVFNAALAWAGFGPVPWLTQHPWTLVSAMLVTLWKGFGFYMMVFSAALLAVPAELKEAAAIDGATRASVFRHVTLPAIWPSVALVFVVSSISALKVFEELYVTVGGTPIESQTIVPLLYRVAFEEGQYGLASAIGVLLFLVILAFSLINSHVSTALRKGGGRH